MAPRTSAGGATRKQAHSYSRSGVARRTRLTRSASRDLDASDSEEPGTTRLRRSARQASIDSDASVPNSASESSRPDRRSRNRSAQEEPADLSVVDEDAESGQGEGGQDGEGEGEGEGESQDVEQEIEAQLLQSSVNPLLSPDPEEDLETDHASEWASQSEEEGRDLDPILVQFIPDLFASSRKIIDQLAPGGITPELIQSIARQLKTPNSLLSIRFSRDEQTFRNDRQFFGENPYIDPAHIYAALFGDRGEEVRESGLDFNPDPILHAANLATLLKDIFVTAGDDPPMPDKLLRIDPFFPELFLNGFDEDAKLGNSRLQDMTFELSLAIRTQCVITALAIDKTLDPEATLLSHFFENYASRLPQMSHFDETCEYAEPREIMRNVAPNSSEQDEIIRSRAREIQVAFQMADGGPAVDFDRLDEMFPWSGFLQQLSTWGRKRIKEIKFDVNPPEGVDHIFQSLTKAMNSDSSEADPVSLASPSPPAASRPEALPRTIIPANAGQNLYNGAQNVLLLEQIKRQMSMGEDAPSRPSDSARPRAQTINRASAAANIPPATDEPAPVIRQSQEYVDVFEKYTREGNKENRPAQERRQVSGSKRSTLDRQPDDHDDPLSPPKSKRQRSSMIEDSQDDDFQDDARIPDPSRREAAPVPAYRHPASQEPSPPSQHLLPTQREASPPEMIRYDPGDHRPAPSQPRKRERFIPQYSRAVGTGEEADDDDDNLFIPAPSYQAVTVTARHAVMQNTMRPVQKRVFWSASDEDRLVYLIEMHGPSWATIEQIGGFERGTDQVALKDKARNMKVAYLKSGIALPENFDKVPLGKKEVAIVQRVRPDWQPS